MILSASGWRKVFAESGDGEDKSPEIGQKNTALSALIAETFAEYISSKIHGKAPLIAVATDTRPTGPKIADAVLRVLILKGISVHYVGVAAAPEIMAYAKSMDGFLYISASHNPIGHNGIKFGLNDGGVLPGSETARLIQEFERKCAEEGAMERALEMLSSVNEGEIRLAHMVMDQYKKECLWAYEDFIATVITGTNDVHSQDEIYGLIKSTLLENCLGILADMNGSARSLSIDEKILPAMGINFLPFNNEPGTIAHAIIPEPENLVWTADVMDDLHKDGMEDAILGYMPDCDGDRGNIVYWNSREGAARIIPAQDVFALSVIAEEAFEIWKQKNLPQRGLLWKATAKYGKKAVAVNGPTSLRIDEICRAFGIEVFRAEVGEANVVNLAREKRDSGYTVRILGEGSNGGNITYPSSVRDPLATIMAIVKLLAIRDGVNPDGTRNKGLFHIWCEKSDQEYKYRDDFDMADVMATIPEYVTTGVSEKRAVIDARTEDKGVLKENFRRVFLEEWKNHKLEIQEIYHIHSYVPLLTNGTVEREPEDGESWNNGNGGLKVLFKDAKGVPCGFIWMRPSGTEPVFRIMSDYRGTDIAAERSLLRWETTMLKKADEM
ncbi:MAG: phosphoglucomutase [Treponema sp.]|nr:phosphoglucomutase [Treponema sp.]